MQSDLRIIHPTDFSEISIHAFNAALRMAVALQCKLLVVHVHRQGPIESQNYLPHVRQTLGRWGLLPKGQDTNAALEQIGLKLKKVMLEPDEPVRALLQFVDRHPPDLFVLSTRAGQRSFFEESVSERLVRQTKVPTLFLNPEARNIVNERTGEITVKNILFPVDGSHDPAPALSATDRFLAPLGNSPLHLDCFHVGQGECLPPIRSQQVRLTDGPVVETVLNEANVSAADVIVMTTSGHDELTDTVFGSTTERVLRRAPCGVLAVPV